MKIIGILIIAGLVIHFGIVLVLSSMSRTKLTEKHMFIPDLHELGKKQQTCTIARPIQYWHTIYYIPYTGVLKSEETRNGWTFWHPAFKNGAITASWMGYDSSLRYTNGYLFLE